MLIVLPFPAVCRKNIRNLRRFVPNTQQSFLYHLFFEA